MIDFIRSFDCHLEPHQLEKNQHLMFPLTLDPDTAEILQRTRYADYNGLRFSITKTGAVGLSGSLHKYHNGGLQNFDDFSYSSLISTIQDLHTRFGINPLLVYINNLEFGVNIELPYKPRVLIDNIVTHRYKPFNVESGNKILYAQAKYDNFIVKVYDKGLQYGLNANIIRFEIKVLKMVFLRKTGIKTLWDLTDNARLSLLKEILIKTFNDILFWDKTIDLSSLNRGEQAILSTGWNPKFWTSHLAEAGTNASKRMRQYKNLVGKHGKNQFYAVSELIGKKWDSLLVNEKQTVRVLTEFQDRLLKPRVRVLTEIPDKISNLISESVEPLNTSIHNSSIVGKVISPPKVDKVCVVTGVDISMQKETSRFLSISGIRFIFANNPALYSILQERLTLRWKDATVEKQINEIAHSIRNAYHSKRIHTQKAIKRLCSSPSLFRNYDLVSEQKKNIAAQA